MKNEIIKRLALLGGVAGAVYLYRRLHPVENTYIQPNTAPVPVTYVTNTDLGNRGTFYV